MDGVPPNARQLPSYPIDIDQSVYNDDDSSSVCGVVYITSEGGAYNPKSSQPSKLSQQQNAELYEQTWLEQRSRRISNKTLLILVLGLAVLLGISIGIAVGVEKQRHATQQQQDQQGQQDHPGSRAAGAMLTTLPFTALARIAASAGQEDTYSCDALLSTDQVIQYVVDQLQSAYKTQLSSLGIDSVNVAKLSCNGISYSLQQTEQWDNWPMAAAVAATAAPDIHLQKSSSVEQEPKFVELAVDVEMHKHEFMNDVQAPHDDTWIYAARKEAAAATAVILPRIFSEIFGVKIDDGSLQVLQLPTITITSSAALNMTVSATSAEGSAIEVTKTRTDALTGLVLDTQTIIMTAPMGSTPEPPAGSGSSGNDGNIGPMPADSSSSGTSSSGDTTTTSPPVTSSTSSTGGGDDTDGTSSPTGSGSSTSSSSSSSTSAGEGPVAMPGAPQLPPGAVQPEPQTSAQTCQAGDNCALPNALSTCSGNRCTIYSCLPGWQDCDGVPSNGCEADALRFFTDSSHCGGCGKICLAPLACIDGKCGLPTLPTATNPRPPSTKPQDQPPADGTAVPPQPPTDQTPTEDVTDLSSEAEPEQTAEQPPTPSEPPAHLQPQDGTGAAGQPGTAAAVPKPSQPITPTPVPDVKIRVLPTLYDDYARIIPAQSRTTLDVLSNDNLGGYDAKDVTISIVASPAAGSATVLPAAVVLPATATSAGSATAGGSGRRQTLLYIQSPNSPLAAGQEVTLYYTVNVAGQPTPAPAAVTLIGAVAAPNPSLLSCAPAAVELPGTLLLKRDDDKAVQVKLPFAMPLYGGKYTTATVSSNGWISFGDSGARETCNVDTAWPGSECLGKGPVMAVFWDDLLPDSVLSYHDKQLGVYIIQWTNVMFPSSPIPLGTFQVHMFQNGSVGYIYTDLFGTDQGLGSSAVIGIRGPTSRSKQLQRLLERTAGEHGDSNGMWFYASGLNDPDYLMTVSAQRRSLNPGLALISHPQRSTAIGNTSHAGSTVPGKFQVWTAAGAGSSLGRSLVAPGSPANPSMNMPTAAAAHPNSRSNSSGGAGAEVVTLSWSLPLGSPAVQQYRLFVAADPMLSDVVRQPAGEAFSPADIPGSTRSVDVVLGSRFTDGIIHVLLLACNEAACSTSCVQQLPLGSAPTGTPMPSK